jgi:multidrug resistance efflux pump
MASRGVQLDEVKAALAALQVGLNEAKGKVNRAEERLEKATTEQDIQKCKALLESASANLTRLGLKEAELLKRESQMNISEQGISS